MDIMKECSRSVRDLREKFSALQYIPKWPTRMLIAPAKSFEIIRQGKHRRAGVREAWNRSASHLSVLDTRDRKQSGKSLASAVDLKLSSYMPSSTIGRHCSANAVRSCAATT